VAVLLQGIDTLSIGYEVENWRLRPDEWELFETSKIEAQKRGFDKSGTAITFRGLDFSVLASGSSGYKYALKNDDVMIRIKPPLNGALNIPAIQVAYYSQYLWRHGWRGATERMAAWLNQWADISSLKISRLDMCIDLDMALPDVNLRHGEAVTRARKRTEYFVVERHCDGIAFTGYTFGKGSLMARIYDKVAEVAKSDKRWFLDAYKKKGWDESQPVTRVEFQMRRDFLRDMTVNTLLDLESQMGDLWKYLTSWLSLREYSEEESNRSRWQLKDFWKVVVDAVPLFGSLSGVMRLAQRRPKFESSMRLLRGVASTAAALVATTTSVSTSEAAEGLSRHLMAFMGTNEFREDVGRKTGRLALMPELVPVL